MKRIKHAQVLGVGILTLILWASTVFGFSYCNRTVTFDNPWETTIASTQILGSFHSHGDAFVFTQPDGATKCQSVEVDGGTVSAQEMMEAYQTNGFGVSTVTGLGTGGVGCIYADPSVASITYLFGVEIAAFSGADIANHTMVIDSSTFAVTTETTNPAIINDHASEYVILAHPNDDSAGAPDDFMWQDSEVDALTLANVDAVEIINGASYVNSKAFSVYTGESIWDYILTKGTEICGIGSDNAKNDNLFTGVGGGNHIKSAWTVINVPSNTAANVMTALEECNLYATMQNSGNTSSANITGYTSNDSTGVVTVTTSSNTADNQIIWYSKGRARTTCNDASSCSYTAIGNEQYLRARVCDDHDNDNDGITCAFGPAIFLNKS